MSFFKASDGAEIFYEVDGQGDKTILLSPGGGCTTRFYDPFMKRLAENCRVVRYDFRGHGGSERCEGPVDADRMVEDVRELKEHLKLGHVYLAGWSLGAMVSVLYIDKYGDVDIDGLIYIDMTPSNMGRDEEERVFTTSGKVNADEFMTLLYNFNMEDPTGEGKLKSFFGTNYEAHRDMLPLLKREGNRVAIAYRQAVNIMGANQDTREALKRLRVPMLHMYGTAFKVFPKAAVDYIGEHVRNVRQVPFKDCGHALFMEEPDQFIDEVLCFIGC